MKSKLHYNTVSPLLLEILTWLSSEHSFKSFRLVGGTALSLIRGHRKSVDIDFFTDSTYGSIDFTALTGKLEKKYNYLHTSAINIAGNGISLFAGHNENEAIKLDLYHTDLFIREPVILDSIRMAAIEDIIAMKADVLVRGGRKKDFWDLHELMNEFSFAEIARLHQERFPFHHEKNAFRKAFTDFSLADEDFEPVCLRGKHWELIKLDVIDFINGS